MNADGSGRPHRLAIVARTGRRIHWLDFAWAPDGRRLAVVGNVDNRTWYGENRIYIRTPDRHARDVALIERGRPGGFAWSPDGRRIVYIVDRRDPDRHDPALVLLDVGTGRKHLVLGKRFGRPWPTGGPGRDPAWSPDGSWIVFRAREYGSGDAEWRGLTLVRPDGRGLRRLTRYGDAPDWSPSSRRIVFMYFDRTNHWAGIAAIDRDGSHLRRLTRRPADADPEWSPDGSHILFTRDRVQPEGTLAWSTHTDLWIMRPDGSRQRRLVKDAAAPSWQPRPWPSG